MSRNNVLPRTWNRPCSGRLFGLIGLWLSALILVALIGGCQSDQANNGMANSYYLNPHRDLTTLGRVALVELDNKSGYPTISADLTEALFVALQKKQLFGLSVVRQDDPAWRGLQENLDSLQALKQLLAMRDALKCNGLLVGTVTEYQPYPRMAVGLRLKLLDLTDGQLLWGLEQVWDSGDASIRERVRDYARNELRSGSGPLQDEIVVISSLKFGKFIAYEVAETLDRKKK
ncbi:MAG: hypothetical protein JW993_03055 [Sedimentisphaerales bacterium]|nr:hypothetical protein [Sedimentisphaerales bacterium]